MREDSTLGRNSGKTDSALHRAKRPRTVLAGPYGHPFHPILITIPIGTWVASAIFDLVAIFGDDPEPFVRGAMWLIGIGIIGALLAAVFGFMDFFTLTAGTRAHRLAVIHMTINLVVVALFIIGFIIRMNASMEEVSVQAFVISLIGLALLGASGYLGGELSYHYGVRVADEETQARGH